MKKMNAKGFTLIELLAVIVILAVLILLAMPQVMNLMEDARKNAFKTETQSILKSAENAFVTKTMSGEIKTLNIGGTQYRYLCMSLADFKTEGLMDKDFVKNGYSGIVEIFVPSTGTATYGISISNGTYSFELYDDVSVEVLLGNNEIKKVSDDTKVRTSKASMAFIGFSVLCVIAYIIVSGLLNKFSFGTLICMFVICFPIQLFL